MGLAELSRACELSKTTTRRVLSSLEQHGFCEREPTEGYRLGLRLFELGMLVQARLALREISRTVLEDLARHTELTAFLCTREDDQAICIDRIDGRFAFTLALRLGGTLPLHAGGASRAILAFLKTEDIERYLATSVRTALTPATRVSTQDVLKDLAEIQAQGWSLSDEDVTENVAAIGAPIFDHAGEVAGGISIAGLVPYVKDDRFESLVIRVLDASAQISAKLGYTPNSRDASAGGETI